MAWGSYAIDATHRLDGVRVDDGGLTGHSSTQARCKGVKRYFYSSSACVYNDDLQLDPENPGLKEGDAWPAKPQDTYGLEKLYAEEMGIVYGRDFGIKFRCARFHNVYGPRGTWKGGREKAPAAFCRKAVCATTEFEMWGDGKQTRSFMFIDDCVQGIQKIMDSDCEQPLNLGSDLCGELFASRYLGAAAL